MPKKILFFCGGSYVFGKEIITLNLLKELHYRGVNVHCIVNGWNNGDFVNRLKSAGISYSEIKLGFIYINKPLWTLDSLFNYPLAFSKIAGIMKTFSPDYIYFNSERTMFSVYPLIKGKNIFLHVHEPINNSKLNNYIFRCFKKSNVKYIACSNYIKNKIASIVQDNSKIHVLYNGIEIKEKRRVKKNHEIKIGIVGQVRHHKGHDILLKALSLLKKYSFTCLIFGDGDENYTKDLKELSISLGVAERIIFKGFEKDTNEIYSELDIVVVPSRFEEAFGLVAIEPAQWKIPVIVSSRGALPEVVVDGMTGLVFENENEKDLASKIKFLFDNVNERKQLGKQALERSILLFDKKEMGEAFLKFII